MTIKIINKKQKNRGDKSRVSGIGKLMSNVLFYKDAKRIFKSFGGMLSWDGGIGRRTGLINQRREQRLAGSNLALSEIPVPSAFNQYNKT